MAVNCGSACGWGRAAPRRARTLPTAFASAFDGLRPHDSPFLPSFAPSPPSPTVLLIVLTNASRMLARTCFSALAVGSMPELLELQMFCVMPLSAPLNDLS